jgi:hypothetical protein
MNQVDWRPPEEVFELLGLLREELYRKGKGTWFTASLRMRSIARLQFDWEDQAEPDWSQPPPREAYAEELRRFPRDPEFVPSWLAQGLTREPRPARTHDGLIPLPGGPGGLPTFSDRPVLPDAEREELLRYLEEAPVVATLEGADTDLFSPDRPGVARVHRTDGAWVWSELVIHYLRERRIAPENALVEHARSNGFQVPDVDEATRTAAAAVAARGGRGA